MKEIRQIALVYFTILIPTKTHYMFQPILLNKMTIYMKDQISHIHIYLDSNPKRAEKIMKENRKHGLRNSWKSQLDY